MMEEVDLPDQPHYNPQDTYQMVVMHQDHGRTTDSYPVFDLGMFRVAEADKLANFLMACCQQVDLEHFEGVVSNVLEAWGCLAYRCWLLPVLSVDGKEPHLMGCLELNNEGICEVSRTVDPR